MPRRRRLTKRSALLGLLCIAALALLLPKRLTGKLLNLAQVGAPLADGTTRLVDSASHLVETATGSAPDTERDLRAQIAALEHQVASLSARAQQLEAENQALTAVRGRGLRAGGRLIPTRIVASDALDWRESRWLTDGTFRGVADGLAVASATFHIALGMDDGVRDGLSILAVESLIGVVQNAATHSAQVRLVSDPATKMRAVIGRKTRESFKLLDGSFWLIGAGRGRIEVHDVQRRYIDEAQIKLGDVVLSPPDEPGLPAALVIGTVEEIETDRKNGLLRILQVKPAVDYGSLRQVFVVDPGP